MISMRVHAAEAGKALVDAGVPVTTHLCRELSRYIEYGARFDGLTMTISVADLARMIGAICTNTIGTRTTATGLAGINNQDIYDLHAKSLKELLDREIAFSKEMSAKAARKYHALIIVPAAIYAAALIVLTVYHWWQS